MGDANPGTKRARIQNPWPTSTIPYWSACWPGTWHQIDFEIIKFLWPSEILDVAEKKFRASRLRKSVTVANTAIVWLLPKIREGTGKVAMRKHLKGVLISFFAGTKDSPQMKPMV